MQRTERWSRGFAAALALLTASATDAADAPRLTDLSLIELMNEPVTTVSKKATRLGDAATAITVITADDIRRNGITSIPEALRLVPGFDVARIDASHWAVSSRGFNLHYANTLLVLIDGRSVYTPTFGGVYWDAQDMLLEDIDRIEVIRGPGATLWGANAVNGVVNIISRSAAESQGALVTAALGTEEQPLVAARYGGKLDESRHYRVYAKYFDRNGLYDSRDEPAFDDWSATRFGFRTDWQRSPEQLLTVQGDYHALRSDHLRAFPIYEPPFTENVYQKRHAEGANLVGRWTRTLSDVSHFSVQAYYDSYQSQRDTRRTSDVQIEHRFSPADRHDVIWGAGYRYSEDDLHLGSDLISTPAHSHLSLYTAFAQDEISLVPDSLRLTLGTKMEHNDFTGLEVQPNVRLSWMPRRSHTVWLAASRAVSTPSRFYHDTRMDVAIFPLDQSTLALIAFMPNSDLPSQKLNAYELGWRAEPSGRVAVDVATFYNEYRNLYSYVEETPFFEVSPQPHLVLPWRWSPSLRAESYGIESTLRLRPLDGWNVLASYSWLHLRVRPDNRLGEGSPAHQASLRTSLDLSPDLELNAAAFYVSGVNSLTTSVDTASFDAYVRVDCGLLYRPSAALELGIWGQNLFDRRHVEFSSQDSAEITQIPRSVVAKVTKRF